MSIHRCPHCGGLLRVEGASAEAPSPQPEASDKTKWPKKKRDFSPDVGRGLERLAQQLGLSPNQYSNLKLMSGPYSDNAIIDTLKTWHMQHYASQGKGMYYFLGILKNTSAEMQANSKRHGGLPPLLE